MLKLKVVLFIFGSFFFCSFCPLIAENSSTTILHPTVIDPGFENGSTPETWGTFIPPANKSKGISFSRDDKEKHSGNFSGRIHNTDSSSPNFGMWTQKIQLSPCSNYNILFWTKGNAITGKRGARIQIYFYDEKGKLINNYCSPYLSGTFPWQEKRYSFETPPKTTYGILWFALEHADGTVWYDDVYIEKVKAILYPPLPVMPVDYVTITQKQPVFKWNNRINASSYTLSLSTEENFSKDIIIISAIKPSVPNVLDEYTGHITATLYDMSDSGKQLKNGKWHWRVKYTDHGGNESSWSAIRSFTVSPKDLDAIVYPTELKHPYLYFTEKDIPAIKEKIKTDKICEAGWDYIYKTAEHAMKLPLPSQEKAMEIVPGVNPWHRGYLSLSVELGKTLVPLAFVYSVTKEKRFAEKAKDIMLALTKFTCWRGEGFSDAVSRYNKAGGFFPEWPSALETGLITEAMGIGYDWIYDYLTDSERITVRSAIVKNGLNPLRVWFDPELSSRIPVTSVPESNWNMVCAGGAGVGALALVNEVESAPLMVRQIRDRVRWWLSYKGGDWLIHDKGPRKIKRADHFSHANFMQDGGYTETLGYCNFAITNVGCFALALKKNTGYDLFEYFPDNILDSFIYQAYLTADNKCLFPAFGDNSSSACYPGLYCLLERAKGDIRAKWLFSKACQNMIKTPFQFLNYNPQIKEEWNSSKNDRCKLFPDLGIAVLRSGWGQRENMLAVKYHQNRGHRDIGTFDLYGLGRKLIVDSGVYPYAYPQYTGYAQCSQAQNLVMVDGQSQKWTDGQLSSFISSPYASIVSLSMTATYPDLLKKWERSILYINPDYYVVIDSLEGKGGKHKYEWLCHPEGSYKINAEDIILNTKDVNLLLQMSVPEKKTVDVADGYIGMEPKKYLKIATEELSENASFMVLLYPYYKETQKPDIKTVNNDNLEGFTFSNSRGGADIILYTEKLSEKIFNDIVFQGTLTALSNNGKLIESFILMNGTKLNVSGQMLFSAENPSDIAMSLDANTASGMVKVSKPGSVNLFCPFLPKSLYLNNQVSEFIYNEATKTLKLKLKEVKTYMIIISGIRGSASPPCFPVVRTPQILPENAKALKGLAQDLLKISASSIKEMNYPEQIMDESYTEGWVSEENSEPPHWLIVEFKKPRSLKEIYVHHHAAETYRTVDFDVQLWDSESNKWVTVDSVRGNKEKITVSKFPEKISSKIRLLVLKGNPSNGNARIAEMVWNTSD